jgi:hypothetical protein
MASDERCRRQIEDQAAIHLLVEVEIEVFEAHLRIAKLCLFPAPFQEPVAATSQFVRYRQERKSMGTIGSTWACCKRVSNTAAIPPRRS